MCTLCRNPVKPEVEYDCENTRYSHSCNAQYGLDDYDQKVGITIYCAIYKRIYHLSIRLCLFSGKMTVVTWLLLECFRVVNTTKALLVFSYIIPFHLDIAVQY